MQDAPQEEAQKMAGGLLTGPAVVLDALDELACNLSPVTCCCPQTKQVASRDTTVLKSATFQALEGAEGCDTCQILIMIGVHSRMHSPVYFCRTFHYCVIGHSAFKLER